MFANNNRPNSRVMPGSHALLMSLACLLGMTTASAEIVVSGVHMFRDTRGINDLGFFPGDRWQYGGSIAGGSAGYSMEASYPPTGFLDRANLCGPDAISPNLCSQTVAFSLSQIASPWDIRFFNDVESITIPGPSLTQTAIDVPFPTNVTISNSSGPLTPTLSWSLPSGYQPNGFRTNVYDKGSILVNGSPENIYSVALAVNAANLTLPSGLLQPGGNYTIDFQVIKTIDDVPFTNQQTEILSRSRSFFAFSPLPAGDTVVAHLPQVEVDTNPNDDRGPVYHFTIGDVGPAAITFIDPDVAIGYDYAIGTGDPNFASVLFPQVGDGVFELQYQDGSGPQTTTVLAGDQFFFLLGGVSAFSVRGIETSAALDPANSTAFITGLTFVQDGAFTGTMTPITAAVPEPQAVAMLLGGLGVMGALARRKQSRQRRAAKVAFDVPGPARPGM